MLNSFTAQAKSITGSVAFQLKAPEHFFLVVLFIMMFLMFENSSGNYLAVQPLGF